MILLNSIYFLLKHSSLFTFYPSTTGLSPSHLRLHGLLVIGVEEQRTEGKDQEHNATNNRDGAHGDPLGHHSSSDDGQSSAHGMSQDTAQNHTKDVLAGTQNDCCQLRSISPLGQEGHGEGLHEDTAHHVLPARLALADYSSLRVLSDQCRVYFFVQLEGGML